MPYRFLWLLAFAPLACLHLEPNPQGGASASARTAEAPAVDERWVAFPGYPPSPPPLPTPEEAWAAEFSSDLDEGAGIAAQAGKLVGLKSLGRVSRAVNDDCVGFVKLAYAPAGISLMKATERGENGVSAIYREALEAQALHAYPPLPGDLVFFRETYDRNGDGRRNDGMTHVGVVTSINAQGTVTFAHRAKHGVVKARFNPRYPTLREDGVGDVLNDFLRPVSKRARAYLGGELFVAFASPRAMRHGPVDDK